MPKRSSKNDDQDGMTLARAIVEAATGESITGKPKAKNPAAVALGKLGGKKGGPARAAKLSPTKRKAIAKKAARARWGAAKK